MTKRIGLYPGTFDPLTLGHMDIIDRARGLVDHLIIGVAHNARKKPLFTIEERVSLVTTEIDRLVTHKKGATVEIMPFSSLLVHFAQEQKATVLVRGLRAVSDFEYEFQMAAANRQLMPQLETVFLMASENCQFIASRIVKEIACLGGDVGPFVSPDVHAQLKAKFSR